MMWIGGQVLIMDIRFPGESQMIDRIIERFSHRYYECNPAAFATQVPCHAASCSSPNQQKQMTRFRLLVSYT